MTANFDDDYDISVQCPHIAFDIEQFLIENPDANLQILAEAIRGADNVYGGITVYDVTATRLELHPDSPLDQTDDYQVLDLISQQYEGLTREDIAMTYDTYIQEYARYHNDSFPLLT
jgi:hypothetical protein